MTNANAVEDTQKAKSERENMMLIERDRNANTVEDTHL